MPNVHWITVEYLGLPNEPNEQRTSIVRPRARRDRATTRRTAAHPAKANRAVGMEWRQVLVRPATRSARRCPRNPAVPLGRPNGAWGYQFAIECETKAGHSIRAILDPIGSFVGPRRARQTKRSQRKSTSCASALPCKRPPYTCASKASPLLPRPCSRSRCAAKARCPLRRSLAEIRPSPCRRKARWFCGPS